MNTIMFVIIILQCIILVLLHIALGYTKKALTLNSLILDALVPDTEALWPSDFPVKPEQYPQNICMNCLVENGDVDVTPTGELICTNCGVVRFNNIDEWNDARNS